MAAKARELGADAVIIIGTWYRVLLGSRLTGQAVQHLIFIHRTILQSVSRGETTWNSKLMVIFLIHLVLVSNHKSHWICFLLQR